MKRFHFKKIHLFKYSPFVCNKLKKLKKKKWVAYKRFNFRNYLSLKRFFRYDFIKLNKRKNLSFLKKLFKEKLNNKQWLKHTYGGIKNKNFKKIVFKSKALICSIESRLDITIFRSNLISSLLTVRHLINHKKVKVNNKVITKPSLILKQGDIVSLKSKENKKIIYFVPMRIEISQVLKTFIVLKTVPQDLLDFFIFKQIHFHKIYSYFVSHKKS